MQSNILVVLGKEQAVKKTKKKQRIYKAYNIRILCLSFLLNKSCYLRNKNTFHVMETQVEVWENEECCGNMT